MGKSALSGLFFGRKDEKLLYAADRSIRSSFSFTAPSDADAGEKSEIENLFDLC